MLLDMVLCIQVPDSKLEAALYFFTTIHSCYDTATFDCVLGLCGKVLDAGCWGDAGVSSVRRQQGLLEEIQLIPAGSAMEPQA